MLDLKKNFENKPQFILTSLACLFALIAFILYLATGVIKGYTEEYSPWLIVFLVLGLLVNIFTLFKRLDTVETIPFITYVIAFILFFTANSNYLVAVIRAIDITSVSASFVLTAVLLFVAAVVEIVGVCLGNKKKSVEVAAAK